MDPMGKETIPTIDFQVRTVSRPAGNQQPNRKKSAQRNSPRPHCGVSRRRQPDWYGIWKTNAPKIRGTQNGQIRWKYRLYSVYELLIYAPQVFEIQPFERYHPKRNVVFQSSFLRCELLTSGAKALFLTFRSYFYLSDTPIYQHVENTISSLKILQPFRISNIHQNEVAGSCGRIKHLGHCKKRWMKRMKRQI